MAAPPGSGGTSVGWGSSSGAVFSPPGGIGASADPYVLLRSSEIRQMRDAIRRLEQVALQSEAVRLRKRPHRPPSTFFAVITDARQVSGSEQYEFAWALAQYNAETDTDDPSIGEREEAQSSVGVNFVTGAEEEWIKPAYWATREGVWGSADALVGEVVLMHRIASEFGESVYVFTRLATMWEGWAILTGSTEVSERTRYAWSEVEPSGDTFAVVSGGKSGTTSADYAVNASEDDRQYGTPIAANAVVWMREAISDDGSSRYFRFELPYKWTFNARISSVSGSTNATYNAVANGAAGVTVTSATPRDRRNSGTLDYAAKSVGDDCTIGLGSDGSFYLANAWEDFLLTDCGSAGILLGSNTPGTSKSLVNSLSLGGSGVTVR